MCAAYRLLVRSVVAIGRIVLVEIIYEQICEQMPSNQINEVVLIRTGLVLVKYSHFHHLCEPMLSVITVHFRINWQTTLKWANIYRNFGIFFLIQHPAFMVRTTNLKKLRGFFPLLLQFKEYFEIIGHDKSTMSHWMHLCTVPNSLFYNRTWNWIAEHFTPGKTVRFERAAKQQWNGGTVCTECSMDYKIIVNLGQMF